MDFRPYRTWLEHEGYQPSTVAATLLHLRRIYVSQKLDLDHNAAHLRRYLRFVHETGKHPLGRLFAKNLEKNGFEAASEIRKTGQRQKELIPSETFFRMRARFRRGDDISQLLAAYMQSGLRIGDFLDLKLKDVGTTELDKVSRDWLTAASARGKSKVFQKAILYVYQILCPTKRCSYYRMRARLLEEAEKFDLNVDFDTLYKSRLQLQ